MSSNPSKQRKETATAPLHERGTELHATLADDLRDEYGTRRTRVNAGDSVEVMRGDDAGTEGEVVDVDMKDAAVRVEGVTIEMADGEEVPRPVDASNLRIVDLNLEDDRRAARLEGADE